MAQRSIKRIQNDIKLYFKSDLNDHGIYIHFNDKNIFNAKALIIGPDETPYKNGFYFFDINYTEKYPQEPPKVVLCTLNKRTRFNPNLYTGGKVCLSILGTWSGPGWTPCLSTNEVLLSIQSLMNNNPIQNEPGYENLTLENSEDARKYVRILEYHNHLIAVVQMIENIPPPFACFKELIESKFCEFYKANFEFISKMANSKYNMANEFLRMYSLGDTLNYSELVHNYKEIYERLGPVYDESFFEKQEKLNAQEQEHQQDQSVVLEDSKSKRKLPTDSASNYDEGYVTTYEGKEYKVKVVNGKGGTQYKRWVLNK